MITTLKRAAAALAIVSAAVPALAATPYALHSFTLDGATNVDPVGINNAGTIVGYASFGGTWQAFTLQGGAVSRLSAPGAVATYGWDASDGGDVVGIYDDAAGQRKSFVYSGGAFTDFSVDGAVETDLRGISPDGRYLTGYYVDADLGAMHGFVQDRSTGTMVLSIGTISVTIAQGINSHGQVAGSETDFDDNFQVIGSYAFIDGVDGSAQHFSFDGYYRTYFRDITSDGLIAGWLTDTSHIPPGGGMATNLGFIGRPGDLWLLQPAPGDQLQVTGINDAGIAVGVITHADGSLEGFTATPVPEPATWVLSLGGLLALATLRRRRG